MLVSIASQLCMLVQKQVCRLSAAYIAGTSAIRAYTQLNGQTAACQALLDAIDLPVMSVHVQSLQQSGSLESAGSCGY